MMGSTGTAVALSPDLSHSLMMTRTGLDAGSRILLFPQWSGPAGLSSSDSGRLEV